MIGIITCYITIVFSCIGWYCNYYYSSLHDCILIYVCQMINVIHVLGTDLGMKEKSGTMCTFNPYVMMN